MACRTNQVILIILALVVVHPSETLGIPMLYEVVNSYPFPQLHNGGGTGLTHDGESLLFLTQQPGAEDIYFLDPRSGEVRRRITPQGSGLRVIASMAWDGKNIQVGLGGSYWDQFIHGLDPITGVRVSTVWVHLREGIPTNGLAYDGTNFFSAQTGGRVTVYDATNGDRIRWYPFVNTDISALAFGGDNLLFVGARSDTNEILAIDLQSGDVLSSFPAPGSGRPQGLAFDGRHLFVADSDDNTIYVMAPIPEPVTAALSMMGLAGLSIATRRRRRATLSSVRHN